MKKKVTQRKITLELTPTEFAVLDSVWGEGAGVLAEILSEDSTSEWGRREVGFLLNRHQVNAFYRMQKYFY